MKRCFVRAWGARVVMVIAVVVGIALPRVAAASKCVEVSDVVGEQHCRRYGDGWSIEGTVPLIFRFGLRYSEVPIGTSTFDENDGKGAKPVGPKRFSYRGSALGISSLSGFGVDGGFGGFVWGQLYIAGEGSFSIGHTSTNTFSPTSGVTLSTGSSIDYSVLQFGLPVGYRIPLGRASIRGEVLPGVVGVSMAHHFHGPNGSSGQVEADTWRAVVEPRIAADIWFTQHISVGAYAGLDVLAGDSRARAFGFSLVWHLRSFDGDSGF